MSVRDLIIVGAGPSGLSAAIAAKQRGLDYQVLEQGVLVNSIYRFPPQMVFFTTPELLEIGGLPFVSPYEKPTRAEALRYYRKVVDTYDLQIAYEETVVAIDARDARREDDRVFAVETRSRIARRPARRATRATSSSRSATTITRSCSAFPARTCRTSITTTASRTSYYRQRVVVVGGGNSAAESALEMYRAGAHVTLVHRGAGAEVDDQVLGAAGHREPDQGRVDRGAVQHVRHRDSADVGRR